MSEWIKKLIGLHTCWNCNNYIDKKNIYKVTVDTRDGPLNLTMCQECAEGFDDMLKELEEVIAERNKSL
jgi:hypothetical protein